MINLFKNIGANRKLKKDHLFKCDKRIRDSVLIFSNSRGHWTSKSCWWSQLWDWTVIQIWNRSSKLVRRAVLMTSSELGCASAPVPVKWACEILPENWEYKESSVLGLCLQHCHLVTHKWKQNEVAWDAFVECYYKAFEPVWNQHWFSEKMLLKTIYSMCVCVCNVL